MRRNETLIGLTLVVVGAVGGIVWLRAPHTTRDGAARPAPEHLASALETDEVKRAASEPRSALPPAAPSLAPQNPSVDSYEEAQLIIDVAIAAGKWSAADQEAMRHVPLSPDEHAELLGKVIVAINSHRLKAEVHGRPF